MSARERYLEAAAKNPQRRRGMKCLPVEPKHRECAKAVLRRGKTIKEALLACGYNASQATKGLYVVRHNYALRTAFREETEKIEKEIAAGPLVPNSWNAREQLILDRLERNVKQGKDGGAMSCKILGSHKNLDLWTPIIQQGVIILHAPPGLAEKREEKIPDEEN